MRGEIERFLRVKGEDYSDDTRDKYRRLLLDLAAWLSRERVAAPTTEDLQRWIDTHQWGAHQRHVAVYTLRSYFGWAIGPSSPAHALRKPRRSQSPHPTISRDQALRLLFSLDTMGAKGRRDLAILCLMLDQGLRAGEVCRLELEHLQVEERIFFVLQKGRRWRQGAFSVYTRAALSAWLAVRPSVARPETRTVFCSLGGHTPGRPFTRYGLLRLLQTQGRRAGIGPVHPHMFRRGMAVMMARLGAPQPFIQLAGGWDDPDQVRTYTLALDPKDADPWFPTSSLMGG